jgi:hypothetical protein
MLRMDFAQCAILAHTYNRHHSNTQNSQMAGVLCRLLPNALCLIVWLQRMEWGAWVAWTRVVLEAALQHTWPQKEPLEVLSKGLVGGL